MTSTAQNQPSRNSAHRPQTATGDDVDKMVYRHGDVGLKRIAAIPKGAKAQERRGDIILAEGEVTGHAHRIADPTVRVWCEDDKRYIEVTTATVLDHEEHGPITLEPGIYEVLQQREYTDVGLRDVRD